MPDQAPAQAHLPPNSTTARLAPELADALRHISPRIRQASRAWRRGEDTHECAYLIFGTNPDAEHRFAQLLEVVTRDPLTPPAWAFPARPTGFNQQAHLTATLAWIDRWCDVQDLPGAKHMLAARYSRDFAHNCFTHLYAKSAEVSHAH